MLNTTSLDYRIRCYERRQWAQVFTIRRDRLGLRYQLLNEAKVIETLTRWFDRVLGRRGYISGRADVRVILSQLHQDIYLLSAVVNVFDDFREDHRAALASLVDKPNSWIVRIADPISFDEPTYMP